jgi:hypothetical protein
MVTATATNEQMVKDGENELTMAEYRALIAKRLKKSGTVLAFPTALLGFREGDPVDFEPYNELGFPHPKAVNNGAYYDRENGDPTFMNIYNGIEAAEIIDDPILVYPYEHDGQLDLVIIDGATRTSIIGYLRTSEVFHRVPVSLFRGTPDEARAAMVRRNLENRERRMTGYEKTVAIHGLHKAGWTVQEIVERLHQKKSWGATAHLIITAANHAIPALWKAFEMGSLSLNAFQKSAGTKDGEPVPEADQKVAAAEALRLAKEGKTLTGEKAKAATKGKKDKANREINPVNRIRKFHDDVMPQIESFLKDRRLFSKINKSGDGPMDVGLFSATCNGLVHLSDEIEKALKPKAETSEDGDGDEE